MQIDHRHGIKLNIDKKKQTVDPRRARYLVRTRIFFNQLSTDCSNTGQNEIIGTPSIFVGSLLNYVPESLSTTVIRNRDTYVRNATIQSSTETKIRHNS